MMTPERLKEIRLALPYLHYNTNLITELLAACSSQQERIESQKQLLKDCEALAVMFHATEIRQRIEEALKE